jgi:hypothetical protein
MIIDFSLNPKKIEMIFLLTAEYSLKTNTEEINMTQTQEQINQNCVETNSSYDFKTTNPDCKERKLFDLVRSGSHTAIDLIAAERYDALEWYKARASYLEKRVAELEEKYENKDEDEDEDSEDEEEEEITEEKLTAEMNRMADKSGMTAEMRERGLAAAKELLRDRTKAEEMASKGIENVVRIVKQNEELAKGIERLRKENEALKSQRPRYTCPQDEDLTGGDANYEYYYTNNEDGELTIWKVPRHLAEIKSSTPDNWDNAVAECFRDEKFGEDWDKLTYLIVREMKLKDLIKRKWKPAVEKPEQ